MAQTIRIGVLFAVCSFSCACPGQTEEWLNPFERPGRVSPVVNWNTSADFAAWQPMHKCRVVVEKDLLRFEATGEDPYVFREVDLPAGTLAVKLVIRTRDASSFSIYWATVNAPAFSEQRVRHFRILADGNWHEYTVKLWARDPVKRLRLDPGTGRGVVEVRAIEVSLVEEHPLEIAALEADGKSLVAKVRNHASSEVACFVNGRLQNIGPNALAVVPVSVDTCEPIVPVTVTVELKGWPPLRRTFWRIFPDVGNDWYPFEAGSLRLALHPSGKLMRIELNGRLVAVLIPLVIDGNRIPDLDVRTTPSGFRLSGRGVAIDFRVQSGELYVTSSVADEIRGECEGPIVRVLGSLEQGLLAGLEYLGKGEHSSSTLDIETEEHLRFAPDPMKVTMPLMAIVTDRGAVGYSWFDMSLHPVFATPNFFDCQYDHRMALRGRQVRAVLHFGDGRLEDEILWAVKLHGLPPLPDPPRSREEQRALYIQALNGPIRNEQGWGHCVEPRWPRRPYADFASTLFRLTGEIPQLDHLVRGGAHIRNDSIYFVTGRAEQWLQLSQQTVRSFIRQQQPDGSYRYEGKYIKGHFENTASGHCAKFARELLDHAHFTGDRRALEAGIRTLEYMKRFRTPRGAQTWELSLHTPDLLASAHLVYAYVRGYELTGNKEYLELARRWALSGIPFVYLWSNQPVMLYATVPVYGATNWKAPNWIGLPVQWVGLCYAYALVQLAPYDDTLDWKHLARGILISAQQQQVPDGPYAGLLPDSFDLRSQQRRGPYINPCAIAALDMVLNDEPMGLFVAADEQHRVVAPFPVKLENGQAVITARAGTQYQLLVDGETVIDVNSKGTDKVPLSR